MQTFTAPLATNYKIECWGAQGGNSPHDSNNKYFNVVYGGKGGYCSGMIFLPNSFILYLYVGQSDVYQAPIFERSFNGGGGPGKWDYPRTGGGATDARLVEGNTWNDFNSLKSRIIVAAGGGGAQHFINGINGEGGYAGGLLGQNGFCVINHSDTTPYLVATGATQTSGGTGGDGSHGNLYGIAENGFFGGGGNGDGTYGSGGGGGYYGGGGGGHCEDAVGSGSGGSSFISGYSGCDAISESSTEDNIIHTGQPNHYSGKVFSNPVMIDGGSTMPKPKGGTETGHSGNGYCIISWISPSL